jgi:hypothetical protein
VTVSREVEPPAPTPAPAPTLGRYIEGEAAAPGSSAPAPEPPKEVDPEEMYEQVLERLKRDFIHDLEASGHLLRDHP